MDDTHLCLKFPSRRARGVLPLRMVTRPLRRLAVLCAIVATMSCGAMRLERLTGPRLDSVDAHAPRLKVHTRRTDSGDQNRPVQVTAAPERGRSWTPACSATGWARGARQHDLRDEGQWLALVLGGSARRSRRRSRPRRS
jgi:hypothetical protein